MNVEQAEIIKRTMDASHSGEITFGDQVGRLAALGVERYHADYTRQERTFYLPDGDSLVVSVPQAAHVTGGEFSAAAVEAAVRQSQRNEHTYAEFVEKTMAAGCVGYFVQITGKQALYFGRRGEVHVEKFPAAPAPQKSVARTN